MLDYSRFEICEIRHPKDCKRIQRVAKEHGEKINLIEAQLIWEDYSDFCCAGWLTLSESSDDEIWFAIEDYFIKENPND